MRSITRSMVLGRALPDTRPTHPLPDQHLHTEVCRVRSRIRALIPGHPHVRCIEERTAYRRTRESSRSMKKTATPAMILLSLYLAIAGYLILTRPICTTWVECDDPVVPYASALFILGTLATLSYGIFSGPCKATRRQRGHR